MAVEWPKTRDAEEPPAFTVGFTAEDPDGPVRMFFAGDRPSGATRKTPKPKLEKSMAAVQDRRGEGSSSPRRTRSGRAQLAVRPDLQLACDIAYTFGWRIRDEILTLTWPQIDLRAGTISAGARHHEEP
jgi:hypothetical protein